jgi:hypothetical protein
MWFFTSIKWPWANGFYDDDSVKEDQQLFLKPTAELLPGGTTSRTWELAGVPGN